MPAVDTRRDPDTVAAMRILPLLCVLLAGCSVIEQGPDSVDLVTDPPGATVILRTPGQQRTMPGVTPMTVELVRGLPEPLEIRFELSGYLPYTTQLEKARPNRPEILTRAEWQWPTTPIHVRLVSR